MPCAANGAGLDWALALRGWCGVCTDTPVVPPSGQAASQPGPPAPARRHAVRMALDIPLI